MKRILFCSIAIHAAAANLLCARPVHVIPLAQQLEKAELVVIAHPVTPTVHQFAGHPGLDSNAFRQALEYAWEEVVRLSADHEVLKGLSDHRPSYDGLLRLKTASLSFRCNAILPPKRIKPIAQDRSKPFCYIHVALWLQDAANPGQPTVQMQPVELDGRKYNLLIDVAASDQDLAAPIRKLFTKTLGQWTEVPVQVAPGPPDDAVGEQKQRTAGDPN